MTDQEMVERLRAGLGRDYEVQRELTGGGMARVFVAREVALERMVVVKVLQPERSGDLSIERFRREIRIAAALQHPHIVPVLSAGAVDGLPFYTMPYVEGDTLGQRLDRGHPMPLHEALTILRDLAQALAFAHRNGVVHRDIKPDNVLLADGMALVADFGIAKALSAARGSDDEPSAATSARTLTRDGTSVGTPGYMAPEQVAGERGVDHRADLYAFGVVAYELLSGRRPFERRTPGEMLAAHLTERPRPLTEVSPQVPPAVAAMVARCLEKVPAERPQGGEELVAVLNAELASGRWAAAPDEPVRIRRALAIYLTTVALVGALAWGAMHALGLPDWVVPGALGLAALGLPIVGLTALTRYAAFRAVTGRVERGWLSSLRSRAGHYLTWRRVALGGATSVGGFGAVVGGFMAMRTLGIGPVGTLLAAGTIADRAAILVTDFASAAEDSTLARVAAEAVRVGLAESRHVRPVPNDAITDALRRMQRPPWERVTLQVARELAEREGIPVIADGDLIRSARGVALTVRLITADSGRTIASASGSAATTDLLVTAAEQVSRRLRARIGDSYTTLRQTAPLERVTTSSLEALRLYTLSWRAGTRASAIELLERALGIDSGFAMAWRRLHVVSGRQDALERAYRHRHRATESEQLRIEAQYFYGRDPARAEALYQALYARDSVVNNNHAWLVLHRLDFARAESLHRQLARENPNVANPYDGLILSLMNQGKDREADSVARMVRQRFPANHYMRVVAAELPCSWHDFAACDAGLDSVRMLRVDASARAANSLAKSALRRGQIARAQRLQREAVALGRGGAALAIGWNTLIDERVRRQPARAIPRLDSVAAANAPRANLLVATWYGMAGRPDRARALLEQWERETPDSIVALRASDRSYTRAFIAQAEGRAAEAIEHYAIADTIRRGPGNHCPGCLAEFVATVHDGTGERDSAIVWWERAVRTPQHFPASVHTRDFMLPRAYERLAALYEAAGQQDSARKNLERFIELWKDADPELQPRVQAARRRLEQLRRGNGPQPPNAQTGNGADEGRTRTAVANVIAKEAAA